MTGSGRRGTRVTDEPPDEGTVTTGVERWLVTASAIVAEPTAMFRATCGGLQTRPTCSFIMTYTESAQGHIAAHVSNIAAI